MSCTVFSIKWFDILKREYYLFGSIWEIVNFASPELYLNNFSLFRRKHCTILETKGDGEAAQGQKVRGQPRLKDIG